MFLYLKNPDSEKTSDLAEQYFSKGAFRHPVNVAIDEHDEPYYGMDNPYLIGNLVSVIVLT